MGYVGRGRYDSDCLCMRPPMQDAPACAGGALPKPKLDIRLQPRQRSATEQ